MEEEEEEEEQAECGGDVRRTEASPRRSHRIHIAGLSPYQRRVARIGNGLEISDDEWDDVHDVDHVLPQPFVRSLKRASVKCPVNVNQVHSFISIQFIYYFLQLSSFLIN